MMRCGGVLFLGVGVLLAAVVARLVWVEQARGVELRHQARRQHTATWTIPAQRGDILDCRGRVLVGSVRQPSVFMDPSLIDDPYAAASAVAPVLRLNVADLARLITEKKDRAFVWVKHGLSDDELEAFDRVRRARRLRAFVVRYEPKREYPYGRMAAHVLGFVGSEQTGLAGIELAFDAALRGIDGGRSVTVDVRRRRLRAEEEEYQPPIDGASVVLTIDAHLQQRAEYHLRRAVEQFQIVEFQIGRF